MTPSAPLQVAVLAFPGAQSLDFVGPLEVLAMAERLRPGTYARRLVTPDGLAFSANAGLRVVPDGSLGELGPGLDTLVVSGGSGVHEALRSAEVVDRVRSLGAVVRRTASVCTGAFLLAEAGLLDGRRAVTHWSAAGRLATDYPAVQVDADPIYIHDGPVWTSAGISAGMDLALALVEDDLGPDVAVAVARWLVLFAKRPGGQAQFSTALAAQSADRRPLREVQDHVRAHPDAHLSVEVLAARAHMSPRNFARAFRREAGATPAVFVESVRLEHAKQMLEGSGASVESVATAAGFGTPETLRRAFARRLGVSPSAYRERFAAAG